MTEFDPRTAEDRLSDLPISNCGTFMNPFLQSLFPSCWKLQTPLQVAWRKCFMYSNQSRSVKKLLKPE